MKKLADPLELSCWPPTRLGEALESLARVEGEAVAPGRIACEATGETGSWLEISAAALGLETEPIVLQYADCARRLKTIGPALLRLPDGRFAALLNGGALLGPDLVVRRLPIQVIRSAIFRREEAAVAPILDAMMDAARISARRREAIRGRLAGDIVDASVFENCWIVRSRPSRSLWRDMKSAGVRRHLVLLALSRLTEYVLWIVAWWMIGRAALDGRLDTNWLLGWVLLLLTIVPFRAVATWLQGQIAVAGGGLIRERLLFGALKLEPDETRNEGVGLLLGRVLESEALESLALSGGFLALMSIIELLLAVLVIGVGPGGVSNALLLLAWTAVVAAITWRHFRLSSVWTNVRMALTQQLVERMIGHRTRMAQQARERLHDGEDDELGAYLQTSAKMDRAAVLVATFAARGWLALGVAALTPAFVWHAEPAAIATGLGGCLLGFRALKRLETGIWRLTGAAIAWKQASPLFQAAARSDLHGTIASAPAPTKQGPLIQAEELIFRYPGRSEPVLHGCSVRLSQGDRCVLHGASGGGKSTLAALLTGLRSPDSGLLLVGGLDRHTVGLQRWRRIVATAPQFHENHVLTGSFAFNLFLGRQQRPGPKDFEEAEAVCRELGLGELIDRMPAGLLQLVGETGWQLSHGERSRLYIARALLQDAELVVLDESFAALDPENLRRAIECVTARAGAVLAIAHP